MRLPGCTHVRDVVLVERHEAVEEFSRIVQDLLGIVPVVCDFGGSRGPVGVWNPLTLQIKHDAASIHDHLDTSRWVGQRFHLHHIALS